MRNRHGGPQKSTDSGHSAVVSAPFQAYRFHQPVRSERKINRPSGAQLGSAAASDGPPATCMYVRYDPPSGPGESRPTMIAVASQGMLGWFHSVHASRSSTDSSGLA